jgi:hypothetical protein
MQTSASNNANAATRRSECNFERMQTSLGFFYVRWGADDRTIYLVGLW